MTRLVRPSRNLQKCTGMAKMARNQHQLTVNCASQLALTSLGTAFHLDQELGQRSWRSDLLWAEQLRCLTHVLVGSRIFTSPCHPNWLWDPLSLCNGHLGIFTERCEANHYLQIVLRSMMRVHISTSPLIFMVQSSNS
jgi:hypothetical protein